MRAIWVVAPLAAALACSEPGKVGPQGPRGEPGPQGVQGPQGPAGPGLTVNGDTLSTPAGAKLGVGVDAPVAALHVAGDLRVERSASLLPGANCASARLANPAAGDLGDLLAPLLADVRCLWVSLANGTVWTWDKMVELKEGQSLTVSGEGFTNGANNITVIIQMKTNGTYTYEDPNTHVVTSFRSPARLVVASNARATIRGVRIEETAADTRALTPHAPHGALFVGDGVNSVIDLSQIRIVTTEDVVSVSSRAFVNVQLGHTFIDKGAGAPRDIAAAKIYTGWGWGGGFGFVHASHTHLAGWTVGSGGTPPTAVAFPSFAGLQVNSARSP